MLALHPIQQSHSRRANTPLSCNGDFRPKLLRLAAHLPGPRRPTKLCPALARFHCPGSLKMRCAGSLPPHRFDCIIHFIFVKSRGIFKFLFFGPVKVILLPGHRCCGACGAQSRQRTPPTPGWPLRSPSGWQKARRPEAASTLCIRPPGFLPAGW